MYIENHCHGGARQAVHVHLAVTLYTRCEENHLHVVNVVTANGMQVDAALGRVDEVIETLIVELKERDIFDCVNIIIVSDHGKMLP